MILCRIVPTLHCLGLKGSFDLVGESVGASKKQQIGAPILQERETPDLYPKPYVLGS
jgi:hypothetical protein